MPASIIISQQTTWYFFSVSSENLLQDIHCIVDYNKFDIKNDIFLVKNRNTSKQWRHY